MESLIVAGMVRSGTTLISRSLNAHSQAFCASDPYMGFFRPLRNDLYAKAGFALADPEHPITDLFCTSGPAARALAGMDLDLAVDQPEPFVRAELERFSARNAPGLVEPLQGVALTRYDELFAGLSGLLAREYGSGGERLAGFKQTWVEPLLPAVCNSFSGTQVVHVIRDPRAVLASWRTTRNLSCAYPFLMILRHWRKSVATALVNARACANYHVVRYEDFVAAPEPMARLLCEKLGLDFDPAMLDVSRFRSGRQASWTSNTSYERKGAVISTSSVEAWKQKIDAQEVALIEHLTEPEMRCAGYAMEGREYDPAELAGANLPSMADMEMDDWSEQLGRRYALHEQNIRRELRRREIWEGQDPDQDESEAERYFIDPLLARRDGATLEPLRAE